MAKSEIKPVSEKQRTMTGNALMLVWFGAAISIMEIWAGGSGRMTALGLGFGILAIVLGRLIGNGLMAAMARMGAITGLPSMVLTRAAFGIRGSYIPSAFNILQLLGWTGWMLFVGFMYLDTLAGMLGLPAGEDAPQMKYVWILLLGGLCTLWAAGGKRLWQSAQRISAALLFILTVVLTVVVLREYDVSEWLIADGGVTLQSVLGGADWVVVMSVSWLPLVADYSRYCPKPGPAAAGTFWGYFIGGTWMYSVGLLVAMAAQTEYPDAMVVEVMGGQGAGFAVLAIALVLLSTVTTTFLDIFSTVVSAQNLVPRLSDRNGNIITGILGVVIALGLNVFMYQPFLEAIGAIFLPAFTIVLADFHFVARQHISVTQVAEVGGKYWYSRGFNWRALTAWVVGFLVYDWAGGWHSLGFFAKLLGTELTGEPFAYGASIPCILGTAVTYLVIVAVAGRGTGSKS